MLKLALLSLVATSLLGCPPKPIVTASCPSYRDALQGHKRQAADEVRKAPSHAVLPDVAVAYVGLTDQLKAEGCPPVN